MEDEDPRPFIPSYNPTVGTNDDENTDEEDNATQTAGIKPRARASKTKANQRIQAEVNGVEYIDKEIDKMDRAAEAKEDKAKKKKKKKTKRPAVSGGLADRNPYEIAVDNEEKLNRDRFIHDITEGEEVEDPRASKKPRTFEGQTSPFSSSSAASSSSSSSSSSSTTDVPPAFSPATAASASASGIPNGPTGSEHSVDNDPRLNEEGREYDPSEFERILEIDSDEERQDAFESEEDEDKQDDASAADTTERHRSRAEETSTDSQTHEGGRDENEFLNPDAQRQKSRSGDRKSKRRTTQKKPLPESYKELIAFNKSTLQMHQKRSVTHPEDWPVPADIEWTKPNKGVFYLNTLMLYTWQCLNKRISISDKAQKFFDFLHAVYMQIRKLYSYRIADSAEECRATDIWFIVLMHLRVLKVKKFTKVMPAENEDLRNQGLIIYNEAMHNYTLSECDLTVENITQKWRFLRLTEEVLQFWELLQTRVAVFVSFAMSKDMLDDPNLVIPISDNQCIVNCAFMHKMDRAFYHINYIMMLTARLNASPLTDKIRSSMKPYIDGFRAQLLRLADTVEGEVIRRKFIDLYLQFRLRFQDYEVFKDTIQNDEAFSAQHVYSRVHQSTMDSTFREMYLNWSEILREDPQTPTASYYAYIYTFFDYIIQQKFQGYDFLKSHSLPLDTDSLVPQAEMFFFSKWHYRYQAQLKFPFLFICNREPIVFIPKPDPKDENKRAFLSWRCSNATEAVILWAVCIKKFCDGNLKDSKLNIKRWLSELNSSVVKERETVPVATLPKRFMNTYIEELRATIVAKGKKGKLTQPEDEDPERELRFDIPAKVVTEEEKERKRKEEERRKTKPQPMGPISLKDNSNLDVSLLYQEQQRMDGDDTQTRFHPTQSSHNFQPQQQHETTDDMDSMEYGKGNTHNPARAAAFPKEYNSNEDDMVDTFATDDGVLHSINIAELFQQRKDDGAQVLPSTTRSKPVVKPTGSVAGDILASLNL